MMRRIISIANIKYYIIALFTILLAVFLCACQKKDMEAEKGGWAHSITDRTVIVSVLSDDENQRTKLSKLSEAVDYITEELKSYAVKTDFVYDWSEDEDLRYYYDFEDELAGENRNVEAASEYLLSDGNREELLEKYNANSILYIFFVDAGEENQIPSECYMWTKAGDPEDEFILMYDYVNQKPEGAMAAAHEILHAFGAKDLYISERDNAELGVPENYVNYLREQGCDDIMFSVYGKQPKIGMTTAYLLGVIPDCPDKFFLKNE